MNRRLQKPQPNKLYLEVKSKLGIQISTTLGYWNVITNIKHPTVKGKELEVKQTLCDPDEIRISNTTLLKMSFNTDLTDRITDLHGCSRRVIRENP